jgi:hypothetical protein
MIYVDELQNLVPKSRAAGRYGARWCHLMTDYGADLEPLHRLAQSIGLKREWFQSHPLHPHYDLTPAMRIKAIQAGALEKTALELAKDRMAKVRAARQL